MRVAMILCCVVVLFAFVASANVGPCDGGACAISRPVASVAVGVAGKSVGVAVKVAAVPVRAVARVGKAVRERDRKPIAKVVSFVRNRR